jgi:hypothetical protein
VHRANAFYLRYHRVGKRHCVPAGKELIKAMNKRERLEMQVLTGVKLTVAAQSDRVILTVDGRSIYFVDKKS